MSDDNKYIDAEDAEYVLMEVEKSFDLKFLPNEFAHVSNFGELCDVISGKINLEHAENCTKQQAFYKIRNAINNLNGTYKITPQTEIEKILPRKGRIAQIKKLEKQLGFKLTILGRASVVDLVLFIAYLIAFFVMFFNPAFGFCGFGLLTSAAWLLSKTDKELNIKTVGDLANKISRENYLKVRRNQKTVNRVEFPAVLYELFADKLGVEKSWLTREIEFSGW